MSVRKLAPSGAIAGNGPGSPRATTRIVPCSRVRTALLLAAVLTSGLACDDGTSIVPGSSALVASPTLIDLGSIFVGDQARADLVVSSVGSAPVGWTSRFVGPAAGFVLVGANGRLGSGQRQTLDVYHFGRRVGRFRAQLELVPDDAEAEVQSVAIEVEVRSLPDCEDGNGCTVDAFDREAGICTHEAQPLPCDDFNACTAVGTCVEGICRSEPTLCDDGDVCTDDLCNPQTGCFHPLRSECDDGNPCTEDSCDPIQGCRSVPVEDGTSCDDGDPCTEVGICRGGRCDAIQVPDGWECDDGDPCSTMDQCIDGECRDPFYVRPAPGELRYATAVGPLAPGAEENPLVGADNGVFVGTQAGVTALDECGDEVWTATTAFAPRFSGAVLSPSALSVPVGSMVWDLTPREGQILTQIELAGVLPEGPGTVEVHDMAARASGALVASVTRTSSSGAQGFLVEVDAAHSVAMLRADFGARVVERLALDQDESLVLLLREAATGAEQVLRLGIDGVPGGSWSTGPILTRASDLGLGAGGEVLWTAGLTRIGARGDLRTLRAPAAAVMDRLGGPPVVSGPWVWAVERDALVARTSTGGVARRVALDVARAAGPVVDAAQRVFVLDRAGVVRGFDADGQPVFALPLDVEGPIGSASLALAANGALIAAIEGRVFAIQSLAGLASSSWPKHRRDNFGTGHR